MRRLGQTLEYVARRGGGEAAARSPDPLLRSRIEVK